jgi:1-acyl-sn-glycerol-3-phosphate acyltransferase
VVALLRWLFFAGLVRPVVLVLLGLNVRRRELLPAGGPAVLVANHNSHLDTMVLMTLFPLRRLRDLRPVGAADYFLRNRWLGWFALRIIGIIPLRRGAASREMLAGIHDALNAGQIVLLFPEGSRGSPERMERFKSGVAHVVAKRPDVPVTPVFLHGLGKALPRGEGLLVPFFCDVFVGPALRGDSDRRAFMRNLEVAMEDLANEGRFAPWD